MYLVEELGRAAHNTDDGLPGPRFIILIVDCSELTILKDPPSEKVLEVAREPRLLVATFRDRGRDISRKGAEKHAVAAHKAGEDEVAFVVPPSETYIALGCIAIIVG
ncbi:MAG TPA: hypothetical protein VNF45_04740 [Candidatus Binataceae bacterium]|nr:hypothetical protein [Candidatus Binataceae bacterium]